MKLFSIISSYLLRFIGRCEACSCPKCRRSNVAIACICIATFSLPSFVYSQGKSEKNSLGLYAVDILRDLTSKQRTGVGIYFGRGLILTAAHVVSQHEPAARVAGQYLQARIVSISATEEFDLALLSVEEKKVPASVGIRRMPLCSRPIPVGKAVDIVSTDGVTTSRIMSPQLLPAVVRQQFPTVISDVATTGDSGSGVLDPDLKCLAGIMSRKIFTREAPAGQVKDIAKYFVPATTIALFIANTLSRNRLAP